MVSAAERFRKGFNLTHFLIAAAVIAALVIADQYTKQLAVKYLKDQQAIPLIEGVLELSYVENPGAAFGMMKGMRVFFLIFAPVVAVGAALYSACIKWNRKYIPLVICLICISAGAVGNFTDRLRLGYVVDFIYFRLINFPVFNVADIFVTCSAFLLIYLIGMRYSDDDLKDAMND